MPASSISALTPLFIHKRCRMVRVIAGSQKNRPIKYGQKYSIRPTQDRVKAAMFSILGDVTDLQVADLFAGTGNLGIEALSRGATHCTFVEHDSQNVSLIRQNLVNLGLEQQSEIVRMDVLHFLETAPDYQLILADPPYKFEYYEELLEAFSRQKPGTRIILETDYRFQLPSSFKANEIKIRRSGDTNLNIFRI